MILSRIFDAIDGQIPRPPEELLPLLDALGRVSARSLSAARNVPSFDISALDGYAVRGPGKEFLLKGAFEPHGGTPFELGEGEAVFVPTGGRFPHHSRFVARERVNERPDRIVAEVDGDERKVVKKGDWMKKGERLLDRGDVVSPGDMARLALGGHEVLRVFGKPQAAIVTTGSELKKGRLVDSNKFLLAGLIKRDGGVISSLHTVDDDEGEIGEAVVRSPGARLIILTGGTSKGKKDLTKQALKRLRFRFHIESPPIVPGKTMAFGRKGKVLFFILPGNPNAVQSLYELFVKRALLSMSGRPPRNAECLAPLKDAVKKQRNVAMFIPVRIGAAPDHVEEMYPRRRTALSCWRKGRSSSRRESR